MRTFLLAILLTLPVVGQGDWNGSWKGANNLQVTIQAKGAAGFAGTIVLDGQSLPFTAQAAGPEKLEGSFTAEGAKFPFTLTRGGGNHLTLASDGTTYLLAPVGNAAGAARPRNPLGGGGAPPAPGSSNSIVGDWQGPQGPVRFTADGQMMLAGQSYRYTVQGSVITLIATDGQVPLPFQLNGDAMTLGQGAQSIQLRRLGAGGGGGQAMPVAGGPVAGGGGRGGIRPELVGKWCYQANVYATNGGARSSSECFTLNADGTYQFYGENDSYNPNGGATGQTWDSGTWTATDTTITANSRLKGLVTYRLEKRNHPKNTNDPMLVLDGQAFVTAWQKPPWR